MSENCWDLSQNTSERETILLRRPTYGADSVTLLAVALCVLQVADGALTLLGVQRFGVAAEGNPFIRTLIEQFGTFNALIGVKVAAILTVVLLAQYAQQVKWVRGAMGAMACVYFFFAVLPWTYLLYVRPLL